MESKTEVMSQLTTLDDMTQWKMFQRVIKACATGKESPTPGGMLTQEDVLNEIHDLEKESQQTSKPHSEGGTSVPWSIAWSTGRWATQEKADLERSLAHVAASLSKLVTEAEGCDQHATPGMPATLVDVGRVVGSEERTECSVSAFGYV